MPQTSHSERLSVPLTPAETAALAAIAARLGTTPEDIAQAALVMYLATHAAGPRHYDGTAHAVISQNSGTPAFVTVLTYD